MTAPEDAVARARAAAAEMRAQGAYADARAAEPAAPATELKLYQWAIVEPDVSWVRSTRRFGAPITAVKRLLLRLLVQYHVQLIADQTRFNVTLLGHVQRLEARIAALEARLGEDNDESRAGGTR